MQGARSRPFRYKADFWQSPAYGIPGLKRVRPRRSAQGELPGMDEDRSPGKEERIPTYEGIGLRKDAVQRYLIPAADVEDGRLYR